VEGVGLNHLTLGHDRSVYNSKTELIRQEKRKAGRTGDRTKCRPKKRLERRGRGKKENRRTKMGVRKGGKSTNEKKNKRDGLIDWEKEVQDRVMVGEWGGGKREAKAQRNRRKKRGRKRPTGGFKFLVVFDTLAWHEKEQKRGPEVEGCGEVGTIGRGKNSMTNKRKKKVDPNQGKVVLLSGAEDK